jgi:DNA-binding transcriptional LysR family regulator
MTPRINLDLDTLRTLVVAHDFGGLAQAAGRLGRTPSAISLQMKRLQDDLGASLFRKRGRGLTLTEAGEVALAYARRILTLHDEFLDTIQATNLAGYIRVGCPQDFASILPSVLSQFASLYPRMQVELFIEGNAALAEGISKSRIDVATIIGHEECAGARIVGQLELVWIAAASFEPPLDQPLPLAALGPQCVFRRCAVQQLEAARIPFRFAASSPSLDGLWAALLGGLGITARTALNLPSGLVSATTLHNLPSLGSLPVTLQRSARSEGVAADHMSSLLGEALRLLVASRSKVQVIRKIEGAVNRGSKA